MTDRRTPRATPPHPDASVVVPGVGWLRRLRRDRHTLLIAIPHPLAVDADFRAGDWLLLTRCPDGIRIVKYARE